MQLSCKNLFKCGILSNSPQTFRQIGGWGSWQNENKVAAKQLRSSSKVDFFSFHLLLSLSLSSVLPLGSTAGERIW